MAPNDDRTHPGGLTEREAKIEQAIASLKWLADECKRAGLGDYSALVEESFTRCLQLYVQEQRGELAERLDPDNPPKSSKLN